MARNVRSEGMEEGKKLEPIRAKECIDWLSLRVMSLKSSICNQPKNVAPQDVWPSHVTGSWIPQLPPELARHAFRQRYVHTSTLGAMVGSSNLEIGGPSSSVKPANGGPPNPAQLMVANGNDMSQKYTNFGGQQHGNAMYFANFWSPSWPTYSTARRPAQFLVSTHHNFVPPRLGAFPLYYIHTSSRLSCELLANRLQHLLMHMLRCRAPATIEFNS